MRVSHSQALQHAASKHRDALANALAQVQDLSHANLEALNQQKLAHARELEWAASTHRQTHDSLLQKLADSESDARQSAEFHAAELAARDQAHEEVVGGLELELTAVKADRDSLRAALADVQQQLEGVRDRASAAEGELRGRLEVAEEAHQEELAAREAANREVVQELEAQVERVVAEKDQALDGKSSEYCQHLAAVAIEHQRTVDAFHTQIRSSESRAQQVQVPLPPSRNKDSGSGGAG